MKMMGSTRHAVLVLVSGLIVLLTLRNLLVAQDPASAKMRGLDTFIAETLAKNRVPGFSIVIVQDDQIVFLKGYGEAGEGKPMTPQTPLYIGSMTKTFTAMAAMQLVEQGKLELDAPVQRYIPWFRVADDAASRQITVRHLLNHTSGLRPSEDPGNSNLGVTMEDEVRRMRHVPSVAPPGNKFQYDSRNYRTLGLLIESVSGQAYGEYLHDHVFAPLGMSHSAAGGESENLAQGYSQMFGFPFPRSERFEPAAQASGYITSSSEDMGHYLIAMLNGGRYAGQILIKHETLRQMMAPPQGIESPYGFGWMASTAGAVTKSTRSEKVVFHGGSLPNFHSFALLVPEKRLGFAFLCNQNSIVPMLTWSQNLKAGIICLLLSEAAPKAVSYVWVGWLLGALVVVTVGLQIRSVARLPQWLGKVQRQARPIRWIRTLGDFVLPAAVFFLLGWRAPYTLLPDMTISLFFVCGLSVVRGIGKLWLVLGSSSTAHAQDPLCALEKG